MTADGVVGPATRQAARGLGFLEAVPPLAPQARLRITAAAQPGYYPLEADFPPLVKDTERRAICDSFAYRAAPRADSDAIVITDGWDRANIVTVTVPGRAGKASSRQGVAGPHVLPSHRLWPA